MIDSVKFAIRLPTLPIQKDNNIRTTCGVKKESHLNACLLTCNIYNYITSVLLGQTGLNSLICTDVPVIHINIGYF